MNNTALYLIIAIIVLIIFSSSLSSSAFAIYQTYKKDDKPKNTDDTGPDLSDPDPTYQEDPKDPIDQEDPKDPIDQEDSNTNDNGSNDTPTDVDKIEFKQPIVFTWSSKGPIQDETCINIIEPAEPAERGWKDNYFCSSKDVGMRWSSSGRIQNMKCTKILETSDPNSWNDNYLCFPRDLKIDFAWSPKGKISGKKCVKWREPLDPSTWEDNYLCMTSADYDITTRINSPNEKPKPPEPKLLKKSIGSFSRTWTDKGSGADKDFSSWRPNAYSGYYPLGDYGRDSHNRPSSTWVFKDEQNKGLLTPPVSTKRIWDDRGSGADEDGAVWELKPMNGYECLGHAMTNSHDRQPNLQDYRCVKKDCLERYALGSRIWKDSGSGADDDVSMWRSSPDIPGIYYARESHSAPNNPVWRIKKSCIK